MKVEDIRLCHSAVSDRVFAGKLNKAGNEWLDKKDVTDDFLNCVLNRWVGFEQTITAPDGTKYEVRVKKVESAETGAETVVVGPRKSALRMFDDPDEVV